MLHPVTGVDYIQLYQELCNLEGAAAEIFLANDPTAIVDYDCDGIIVADIHSLAKTKAAIKKELDDSFQNTRLISLAEICADPTKEAWSEWGLLGSNMSAGDKLKLAPGKERSLQQHFRRR